MRILAFLLTVSLAQGAVTIKTVRSSGGTHAGTLAGIQDAVDECAALDSTDPCVIDVEAGAAYSDGSACFLTLPAQTEGPKLIVIRSSRISELPDGVRVTAADASKLAKIENACASSQAVISIPPETSGVPGTAVPSHYVLQGLDVHFSGEGRNAGGALNIGYHPDENQWPRAYWQAPHTITVDRCWIHGNSTQTWITASSTHANQNGLLLNGRNITVKNSRISDNNMDNADHGQAESHGILAYDSPGALYIYNNYIDGAIGSLMGGSDTHIPALVSSGSWFYGNEYSRDTWAWHWIEWDTTDTLDTSEPCISNSFWEQKESPLNKWKCVAGAWQSSSDNRVNRVWTKNAFECKNCRMVHVEGNYIHDIPSTGDQSQYGYAFLLSNVDAAYGAPQGRVEHVGIRHNRILRTGQGPTTSWGGTAGIYRHSNNLTIENNLFENIGGARVSPTQGTGLMSGGGWMFQSTGVAENMRVAKNTFIYDRTFSGGAIRLSDDPPMISNIYLQDNILPWADRGQTPLNNNNEACSALRGVMFGSVYWDYFGLVDTNSRGSTAYNNLYGQSACPVNQSRAATYDDVKFVDFNDGEDGDYRLCTGTDTPAAGCTASPWATAASDGGPLGADAQQVSRMTAGAVAGTFDAGLFGMKIKAYVGNDLRYTPYHPKGACTVTVRKGNTQTHSQDDEGLIVGERTMSVSTDGAGEYVARITCKDVGGAVKGWREFTFKRYN